MPVVSTADWHAFLENHPEAHLLQSAEWGELKSGFGWKPVRIVNGEAGVQILLRKLPLGFTIGYIPKPVISNQSVSGQFWKEIDEVCRKHRAVFFKLEPDLWKDDAPDNLLRITNYELQISPQNIQPPRTLIVDIHGSEEGILARMKQKTRYNIRLAEKKGVTVRAWDDIEAFHKMLPWDQR